MMRRLYLQIYLAFIGVVVATALVAALIAALTVRQWGQVPDSVRAIAELVFADLPDGNDSTALAADLRARAERYGLDVSLWDQDHELVASAGEPVPWVEPAQTDSANPITWLHDGRRGVLLRLDDGRWLGAALAADRDRRPWWRPFVGLIFFAGVMAVGCYPIARRITRRLESLRRGVDELGRGELSARVEVAGSDEVADLAQSFNAAAARIERLVLRHKRVLASASHELRSPLTRVRMAVELAAEADSPERRRGYLEDAGRDIEELDALIGDVLLAAQIEAGTLRRAPLPVGLLALVRDEGDRAGAAVRGDDCTLQGDEAALRRMLRNLLQNAQRHAGGAAVEAWVEASPGEVLVVVADRGPGVPDAERERIFEPFYRPAAHAEGRDGGVGLGLALVRDVAADHGGSVCHVPREGGGSRFEVRLPRAAGRP